MADIEIDGLRKEFSTPHGTEVAVDGIDLHIQDNEFVTLVGPSGCGKTTTLRCVAGLEKPTKGRILLNGENITDIPPNKRDIAMMFQSIALYPHMTVRENISYPLKVDGISKADRDEPAERVAKTMKIEDMLDKHPGDLSGGQQQRAALARTVVQEPQAFLMDEPLSDLDAKLKVEVRKEIQRIHKKIDKPVLYVTHDQEEAMTMSDRVAVLNDGRIEQYGTPDDIFRYPNNAFVGQFIGSHGMNIAYGDILEFDDNSVTVSIDDNEVVLHFDELLRSPPADKIGIGFRPENTWLGNGSGEQIISGEISLLETFGEETVAEITTSQGSFNAVMDSDGKPEENTTTTIAINEKRAHLFDPETGEVVAHTS